MLRRWRPRACGASWSTAAPAGTAATPPPTCRFVKRRTSRPSSTPSADLPARLQSLSDEGHADEAVVLFQREAVGLPDPVIEQIRSSPMFATLVPLAQSTVYDAVLTGAVSTPTAAMIGTPVPVTILRGEPTFAMLVAATDRLAELMPGAELVVVPESHDHGVDPAGTVREILSRLAIPR